MVFVEIGLLVLLIALNGFFALSELAVVSASRPRLTAMEGNGVAGARTAIVLAEDPGKFLSSVQIGITLVGVLAGAFGGATLSARLAPVLTALGVPAELATTLAFAAVVVGVTYLSLIFGELVPKQVALADPEGVAARVAPIMRRVATVAGPVVWLLENSTRLVLRLLRLHRTRERGPSEEEIHAIIAEAETAGLVEPEETKMIARVMRLGDLSVRAAMTPRPDVDWIDLDAGSDEQLARLAASPHSRLPAGRGSIDECHTVVHSKDVATALMTGGPIDLAGLARAPAVVHDGADLLSTLETLRNAPLDMAFVVDEYGTFEGVVTTADVLGAIAGELGFPGEESEADQVRRPDGSWLVDGGKPIDELADLLDLEVPKNRDYHTLAGFVLGHLRRLPRAGDSFLAQGWRFEVVDMDGRRIDKLLITPVLPEGETAGTA